MIGLVHSEHVSDVLEHAVQVESQGRQRKVPDSNSINVPFGHFGSHILGLSICSEVAGHVPKQYPSRK